MSENRYSKLCFQFVCVWLIPFLCSEKDLGELLLLGGLDSKGLAPSRKHLPSEALQAHIQSVGSASGERQQFISQNG